MITFNKTTIKRITSSIQIKSRKLHQDTDYIVEPFASFNQIMQIDIFLTIDSVHEQLYYPNFHAFYLFTF